MDQQLFQAVDHYISALLEPHDTVLAATEQSIIDAGIPQISISPNQGKFLHMLALLRGAKKILEIGTLGGYSTIWLARALPVGGKIITLELEPSHAAVAQKNIDLAGLKSKTEIRIGHALELLPQLEAEGTTPFDMIFIDADKPPYAEYFQWALRLSGPGTLIVADNVIREGQVLQDNHPDERVSGVRRFNQLLADTPSVTATILQTVGVKEYDGMALAIVK
jgi:caffeoyl-CoA O-methyltransferase